jgi:uncharacterized protein YpmS
MNPVWTLPSAVFQVISWGAIILLAISIVVILVIFVREIRNRQVW